MEQSFRERLERVYGEHPVTAAAVLERVRRERGSLDGLTARDLAEDPGGGATDQNHAGGADATRALATAIGLEADWAVLDIGAGLGGTLRLLAEEYGCRCHGVELTAARFADAVRLTQVIGLEHRVTFTHGDFMEVDVPGRPFDLAIAQSAIMHFPDQPATLRRIAECLRPGGHLAIEEIVITPRPMPPDASMALHRLLCLWNGQFESHAWWPVALTAAGLGLDRMDDITPVAIRDFEQLLVASAGDRSTAVTEDERTGWELGLQLLRKGHLALVRILATRRSSLQ